MDIFGSKPTTVLSQDIRIEIDNEPEFYSPGSIVRGRVIIENKYWREMYVELMVICEEHAEVPLRDEDDFDLRQRRITIVGESLEGEELKTDDYSISKCGQFSFDLRLPDDPHMHSHLPSFEIEQDECSLDNFIRWMVDARVTHKRKIVNATQEIVFVPTRPLPVSNVQSLVRKNGKIKVHQPKDLSISKVSRGEKVSNQFNSFESPIVGIMQLPETGLRQYPSTIPLKLTLLLTHPHLIYITGLSVQLLSTAKFGIGREYREKTLVDQIGEPCSLNIRPEGDMIDLSDNLSDIAIQDQCASFHGKWISMTHHLQITVTFRSVYKQSRNCDFVISTPVKVLPPRSLSDIVDAPPMYSPLSDCPHELVADTVSEVTPEIFERNNVCLKKVSTT